jgi:hypothetical protein
VAHLYFSLGGENWDDSLEFLSALSVCMWRKEYFRFVLGVGCDPMVYTCRGDYFAWPASNRVGSLIAQIANTGICLTIYAPSLANWVD